MFLLCLVTMPFPLRTSLVCVFFLTDEARMKKDFCSASGEQYRHANTEPGIALSSENALGNRGCRAHASRQESLYSRKFTTVWQFVQGFQMEFVLVYFSLFSLQWLCIFWNMSLGEEFTEVSDQKKKQPIGLIHLPPCCTLIVGWSGQPALTGGVYTVQVPDESPPSHYCQPSLQSCKNKYSSLAWIYILIWHSFHTVLEDYRLANIIVDIEDQW